MIGVTGLSPHFRKPENFQKGKIYMFRTTRGNGSSHYQIMVKYTGVLLRRTRSLVPHSRQLRVTILLISWRPLILSLACCMLYSYHSYLVIGMLLCLVRLKEYVFDTQSLGLGWPLSEVGTRVGAEEDLFHPSPPHK